MKKILLFLTMSVMVVLQGCVFAVGAAAGAAAIAEVNDHRSINMVMSDRNIANEISDKIHAVPELVNAHIDVTSFNQVVLLTGQVPGPGLREEAESIAHTVPGVRRVYNQLAIMGPTTSLIHASDAWVTTKIKGQMIATRDLNSSAFKVVTENGTVYLMGIVKHEQADIAVSIARHISGVERVVRIFQYTD